METNKELADYVKVSKSQIIPETILCLALSTLVSMAITLLFVRLRYGQEESYYYSALLKIGPIVWLIALVTFMIIWREPFIKYWRLNIIGYTLWYWLEEGEIKSTIAYRDVLWPIPKPYHSCCILPLGGWFKFCARFHRLPNSNEKNWRLKIVSVIGQSLKIQMRDKSGAKLDIEAKEGFKMALTYKSVAGIIANL